MKFCEGEKVSLFTGILKEFFIKNFDLYNR